MRLILLGCAVLLLAFVGSGVSQESTPPATTPAPAATHMLIAPGDLKWGDPPPIFEKGAAFTVVSGDPSQPGLFVVRLKMPAGYKIAPHWHPADEHVTVIKGTFSLGMGDKFDKTSMKTLPDGSYALLPADMRHYAMAKTAVVVQVHGQGPFALTYVNPEDDPSKRTPAK